LAVERRCVAPGEAAMTAYEGWKYLHILTFVFWIGTDMGVFLSAKKASDPSLSFGTRLSLLHWALRIELLPRTMWKAALPLGVMLSRDLGLLPISDLGVALVWAGSIAWWAISMTGAYKYDQPIGHKLGRLNNWITGIVGASLIALAVSSAAGNGPFDPEATWLLWKVALYGVINLMVVVMIIIFDPMGIAFVRMATEGPTPELERIVASVMQRSTIIIWATYGTIAAVAFIATTKIL
jgi:hypothetical protein